MMVSEGVMIAAIAALPAALTGVAAIIAVVAGKKNHAAIKDVGASLVEVKLQLDGRLDALINASKAQGRLDEQADVKRDDPSCNYPRESD